MPPPGSSGACIGTRGPADVARALSYSGRSRYRYSIGAPSSSFTGMNP